MEGRHISTRPLTVCHPSRTSVRGGSVFPPQRENVGAPSFPLERVGLKARPSIRLSSLADISPRGICSLSVVTSPLPFVRHSSRALVREGSAFPPQRENVGAPSFSLFWERVGSGAIMATSGCSEWRVMHVTDSRLQSSYKNGPEQSESFVFTCNLKLNTRYCLDCHHLRSESSAADPTKLPSSAIAAGRKCARQRNGSRTAP